MPRTSSVPPVIQEKIAELADQGYGGAAIEKALLTDPALEALSSEIPSKRQIQRLVTKHATGDSSPAWSPVLSQEPPEVTRALTAVIADVVEETGGQVTQLTQQEVQYLRGIWTIAPCIPPWLMYRIAREYIRREAKGETTDLDLLLALRPWEGEDAMSRFLLGLAEANLLPHARADVDRMRSLASTAASADSPRWPPIPDAGGSGFFYYLQIAAALPREDEGP